MRESVYFDLRFPAYRLYPSLKQNNDRNVMAIVVLERESIQESSLLDRGREYRKGKENVLRFLSDEKGMEAHIQWISRLPERPDSLPRYIKVGYISLE